MEYVVAGTPYRGMVVGLVSDVQDGRRDSSVEDLVCSTPSAASIRAPMRGSGRRTAL